MPHYYKLGNIPHKRHTQFRKPDGSLYSEQLFSTEDLAMIMHCFIIAILRHKLSKRNHR